MKKKKKLVILSIIIFIIISIVLFKSNEKKTVLTGSDNTPLYGKELNTILSVENTIYVQHNSEKEDVYLLESQGTETTVYELINVKYTADKQWTEDGQYINDFTDNCCATAPDDYVSVIAGETLFVRLYGVYDLYTGENNDQWVRTTPILYMNDNNEVVGFDLGNTYTDSKEGVEIVVPAGATRMHITNFNNQGISIQRKMTLNQMEFNQIKSKQDTILNYLDTGYQDVSDDPILFNAPDKGYVIFVNDDSRDDINLFADLFISKNAPLCLASIADNLLNMDSTLAETRLDVAQRVQNAGGEILVHNGPWITNENITDNAFLYQYFVGEKQKLNRMGLNTNGIILAGGDGAIDGNSTTAKWAYSLYKYSDKLGESYNSSTGFESVYFKERDWLGNIAGNTNQIHNYFDDVIANKKIQVLFFHDTNEVTIDQAAEVLDYINSKSSDEIEIVTYKTLYERLAKRESEIIEEQLAPKTYYVSSDGTSDDGTDINNPINLETLNNKTFNSGARILFKKGDQFFGTIDFDTNIINDEKIKVSSYGEGDLPTISAYKYIGNGWTKHSGNIYKIDLTDTRKYTGFKYDDDYTLNVAFLEGDDGTKYYNKQLSLDQLTKQNDFYSDGTQYLYIYSDKNPYSNLGNLKVVLRCNLFILKSNLDISNLKLAYTGAHAFSGSSLNDESNIIIDNCIIENIGGSYLYDNEIDNIKYGNGIEFYGCNVNNVEIKNNIIRNVYDVGFTIQGPEGSANNVLVHDNVFVSNSQDSEIWEDDVCDGINNYQFYNNYSINQGYGWGYYARPDQYAAAHILFWEYKIGTTDISFNNNVVYNPRRIFFIERNNGTVPFFRDNNYIKSNNNSYYMTDDATIFDYMYDVSEKDDFIRDYGKEANSSFNTIEIDQNIIDTANSSDSVSNIKNLFANNIDTIDSVPDLSGISFENNNYNITGSEELSLNIKPTFQNITLPIYSKGIFIGNGLLHGFGNHGMASSGDTDYYHYVHEALVNQNKAFTDSKVQGYSFEEATSTNEVSAWINNDLEPVMTNDTDIVIIQLGDNIESSEDRLNNLHSSIPQLFDYIYSKNPNCKIYWVGVWYTWSGALPSIKEECKNYNVDVINILTLNTPYNQASIGDTYIDYDGNTQTIDNDWIAFHPSDIGMQKIADKIIKKVLFEDGIHTYNWSVGNENILKLENSTTSTRSNVLSPNVRGGTTTVTVETTINGTTYSATCNVTVSENPITEMNFILDDYVIIGDQSKNIELEVSPESYFPTPNIVWSTSPNDVIELQSVIDENTNQEKLFEKKIKKLKNGVVLVTATDPYTGLSATCNVTVSGSEILPSSNEYAIIVPSNASETENFAAQQLAKYLKQIDGNTYPILTDSDNFSGYSFYIGNTSKFDTSDISNKDDGSYNIVPLDNGLAIYGAGNRGTIYGVYGYLEDFCGYRCFTREGMKSLTNEITIPTETITYNTYFEFTDTDWDSPRDTEYSIANGLNANTHRIIPDEMGGDIEYISSFCHSLGSDFCAANKYFNNHPEYYALYNGQRQPTQLCLTNENVYNIVLDEVIDLLEEYHDPDASLQIISLTQLDNTDYCQCENCTAINNANGSPSGTMIDFVNKIAREVKNRGYNNVGIDTFAYQYTRKPPTQVVPEDNVIVRLCSIECCFSHPLEDDSCEENAQFMDDLKEWNRICNRLYIWDYATNYAFTMTFFPNFKVLQDDIKTYYENGVKGVFVEGNYYIDDCDTEFGELRAYMISRLLRDPYCDIDQVMEEFCKDYYGPGGTYIKKFVDAMCEDATKKHLSIYSQMASTCSITESQAEVLDGYWTQAENLATTDTQRAHLRRSKLSWRVVKDSLRLREFKGTLKETADERQQFYDDIMELGITTIGEFLGDFPTGTNRPYQYIPIEDWRYADGIRLVFFDTNGGEGEPDIELATSNIHIPEDAVPVRAGYTFNGWSLDKNSTEQGMMPGGWYDWPETEDTTVYALWKRNTNNYTISIDNPSWTHLPISQIRLLSITFDPSDAAQGNTLTWSSLNTNIATVDSTGKVTAISNGTATIKVTDNNNITSTYNLLVSGTLGDIDNDSYITSYDAYRALQLSVDQGIGNSNTEDEVVTLDVDRDGGVTAWDAYRILTYSIGLINSF